MPHILSGCHYVRLFCLPSVGTTRGDGGLENHGVDRELYIIGKVWSVQCI